MSGCYLGGEDGGSGTAAEKEMSSVTGDSGHPKPSVSELGLSLMPGIKLRTRGVWDKSYQ